MYIVSTFLDPNFGLEAFELDKQENVKNRIKNLMFAAQSLQTDNVSTNLSKKVTRTEALRANNYKFYKNNLNSSSIDDESSKIELSIDKYIHIVANGEYTDALDFWRKHEAIFPLLALLAKKYLGVQASSCAVERMFSIAGHIFSVKRRRLGIMYFAKLVLLKLNEIFMD